MWFGALPLERIKSRRFAEDRNGIGSERRLSCSLSSFDGTDHEGFEAEMTLSSAMLAINRACSSPESVEIGSGRLSS